MACESLWDSRVPGGAVASAGTRIQLGPVFRRGEQLPASGRDRMVASRLKRVPLSRAWTLATAAALGLVSAGCTMCPDPFDYSGPVPNGSSPQNDFRARSNGILPLGASPRPWPLIVKNDGRQDAGPEQDEPMPTLAGEDAPAELQQTVAVVGEFSEDAGADGELEVVPAGAASSSPALQAVPIDAEPTDAPQEPVEAAIEQADAEAADDTSGPTNLPLSEPVVTTETGVPFQAGETPGWRSRNR